MDRKGKEQVAGRLHEKILNSKMTILASYAGMDVERMTALRNSLRTKQAELKVVKNTLLNIASKETEVSLLKDHFKGPLTITLSYGDVVEPAKALVEFAKKNANLEITAAILNGKVLTREQVGALAELPGREVLLGKLLSVLCGVQTSLVTVLSAVPRGMVQVINAYREKLEQAN